MDELDPKLKATLAKVTAKRPRVVIDHILKHGSITTEDLEAYGYKHPPRAIRDVREHGVPIVTTRVVGKDGRSIGAYTFGDPSKIQNHKSGGRQVLSKGLLNSLYDQAGGRCATCGLEYEKRYLQVDHRIPYEVAGEVAEQHQTEAFMLLCGTCQRKKSWSCEHCSNWTKREESLCRTCYWSTPEDYTHLAGAALRRLELTFSGDEVALHDSLKKQASDEGSRLDELVKRLIRDD
ncbi:MAG: hypothetical protein KGO50_15200 [Myxococcales bacterium]|nr:hypothetical protein [Myxococcales bacterium]